jgi:hypothetical protein
MADPVVERFLEVAGISRSGGICVIVETLRSVPYGRPEPRTEEGLIEQWRGTCSTKHALLVRCLRDLEPTSRPRLIHRVHRVTPEAAGRMFGATAAAAVPPDGLTDVHTYVVARPHGRDVALDVTFPGSAWDGTSDMPIAAGDGEDVPAGCEPFGHQGRARCETLRARSPRAVHRRARRLTDAPRWHGGALDGGASDSFGDAVAVLVRHSARFVRLSA